MLASAKHKTIRQIEELVARLAPKSDVPSTLRALPQRSLTVATAATAPQRRQPRANSRRANSRRAYCHPT